MDRASEFYLMDSASYFFGEVRRICERGYIPIEDDVLRARAKTTGITETRFNIGQLSIQSVTSLQTLRPYCADLSSHQSACLMSAASGQSERSGYIASRYVPGSCSFVRIYEYSLTYHAIGRDKYHILRCAQ